MIVRVKLPLVELEFRRVVSSPISTQVKLMGGSPLAVHTRSTDWPITTGGTEPGCIDVLGGSEDEVKVQFEHDVTRTL